jgi:hypothetical protein
MVISGTLLKAITFQSNSINFFFIVLRISAQGIDLEIDLKRHIEYHLTRNQI